jgi:hypothetical protein
VPDCAPVDLPLKVSRDIAFNQSIALSLREDQVGAIGLPVGISAEILPGATVPPGGNLIAERTLRFRADPSANLGQNEFPIALEATSGSGAGAQTRALPMHLSRATPHATVASGEPGSGFGLTPRFGGEGTRIRVHGNGFCPGTEVQVGNSRAIVPATFVNDRTIEFNVPRFATSGPVTIIPPGGLPFYKTDDTLSVDSVRNSDGFQFKNFSFGTLGIDELTEAFGSDDLFFNINPCWPFGDCKVTTGILNPIAAIDWGVLNAALRSADGHCFGMNLASQRLSAGKDSFSRFVAHSRFAHPRVFEIPGPAGPDDFTTSYLDAMQARQASEEFLGQRFERPKSLEAQISVIEREFSHNRKPMIGLEADGGGHAVLAYDMVQTPASADIYVYDNNHQFTPEEDNNGPVHVAAVSQDVIHIDKVKKTWSYMFVDGRQRRQPLGDPGRHQPGRSLAAGTAHGQSGARVVSLRLHRRVGAVAEGLGGGRIPAAAHRRHARFPTRPRRLRHLGDARHQAPAGRELRRAQARHLHPGVHRPGLHRRRQRRGDR